MAKKPTYYELLQHPKWQQKRLQILEAAGWECTSCGDSESMLQIHHTYYEKGLKPWEYPDASLRCLCGKCHKQAQDWMTLLHRQIGRLGIGEVEELYGFGVAMEMVYLEQMDMPVEVLSYEQAVGMARMFGTTAQFIIHNLTDGVIDGNTIVARQEAWRQDTYPRIEAAVRKVVEEKQPEQSEGGQA